MVSESKDVHSIQSVYNRLADCYHKISNIRGKLEFLVDGEGEYPSDETEHPIAGNPTMRITGEEAFNIEQQINLCNQLVDVLKDGGNRK